MVVVNTFNLYCTDRYLLHMEKLQENLEEYEKLQQLASKRLILRQLI